MSVSAAAPVATGRASGTQRRETRFLVACTWWGAVLFVVPFGIGFALLSQFVPPPSPDDSAAEIARVFDSDRMRIGTLVMMAGTPFIGLWGCAVASQTRRTETGFPVITCVQVACAAIVVLTIAVFVLIWAVASFRAGQIPAETTRTLNDIAFFLFLFDWSPFCLWVASFAVAIFRDQSAEPVFPRWAGYLNMWVVFLSVPGCLIVFFKDGPFAFNGLLGFYVPASAFWVWLVAMTVLTLRALNKEQEQSGGDAVGDRLADPASVDLPGSRQQL